MNKKIVFLVSGGGGNLKFLYMLLQKYDFPFKIISVIGDRQCGAINFAVSNKIDNEILSFNRENDDNLLERLKILKPDFIITNVHKILSKSITNLFKEKLINLHYSLLPAFGGFIGVKSVDEALRHNVKFIGTTVHIVNEKVDNGKILGQSIFEVNKNDKIQNIYNLIFRCGALTLWNFLASKEQFNYNKKKQINMLSYDIWFSPNLLSLEIFNDENFWNEIAK